MKAIAEPVRIQKYIADCGVMSRRAAEEAIRAGNVTVNDGPAEIGMKIVPGKDVVKVAGETVAGRPAGHTYVMLYKPVGVVTTMKDEKGRKCVADLVADVPARVYPVGRLDYESEGLLLLTDDGDLTNRLTHPRHEVPKIYHARIAGEIMPDELRKLSSPMEIDGYTIQPVEVEIVERGEGRTILRFTLYEGRNRQIRKMCEIAGVELQRLKRVAVGDLTLGNLRPGKWKYLTGAQIDSLKSAVGMNVKKK